MAVHTEELARLKAHRWQVSSLEFRPGGGWLASAGWDKEVHIWDLNNLEVYCTLKGVHKVPITNLSWQKPAGQLLCTCSADNTAVLWNVESGDHVRTLTGHSSWVLGSCFSSSGSVLATASWDGSIAIWDTHTGEQINSYTDHTKGVWAVDFHPHSSTVLSSASEDGTVKMWDLREGKVMRTLTSGHSDAVCCAKWSPDGTMIASGSADTKICIWDVNTRLLTNTIYGHTDTVKSLAFNPSNDAAIPLLASAGDYTVLLSDPRPSQKAEILNLSPHNLGKEVEAIGISPDGSLLVSGGRDGLLIFMTLSVPTLRPQLLDDSVSSKLRNSLALLDQSFETTSIEDQAEAISQASTSEGDLSVAASRENIMLDSPFQKSRGPSTQICKKDVSARVSRQRRTEKKVVDLPTMIAYLSASVRGSVMEEQPSSSDSEEEAVSEEQESQRKISDLIHVSQKVDKFSQITKKTSVQEMLHKVPEPRLSLLPDNVPETIKEKRMFFKSKEVEGTDSTDGQMATEYYDGYSSLLPDEPDDSDSDQESYSVKLGNSSYREDITALISSRQHSFTDELGSGDEYGDDVPFSMI